MGVVDIDMDDLKGSTDGIVDDSQALVDTMQILSYGIQQIETLDRMTEEIFHQLEYVNNVHESVKFADDIEMTVSGNVIGSSNICSPFVQSVSPVKVSLKPTTAPI